MAVENTALQIEIEKVLDSGPKDVNHYWSCEIHTPKETLLPERLISVDFIRNYDETYGDNNRLEVLMPRGAFFHRIIPHKNNLTVTVKRTPIGENSDSEVTDNAEQVRRFRAILLRDDNPLLEANLNQVSSETSVDHTDLDRVEFQLIDLALEQLRLKTTGGIVRKAVPANALRALLSQLSFNLQLPKNAEVKGVDLVDPDNTDVRDHVIIPQGTKVTTLPMWIQVHCGGVYSKHMGYYLQNGIWYIYPQFAFNRFSETNRSLTVVSVPRDRYPDVERTHLKDGDKLIVLSTQGVRFHDDSEDLQLSLGNGVRYADADYSLESLVEVTDNKALMRKADRAAEFLLQNRPDGQNTAFFSEERITQNHFEQSSKLSRRAGTHVEVMWDNSNPDYVYPGMPVRYLYQAEDEVGVLEGTLLRAHTYVSLSGIGVGNTRHLSKTVLVLFVEKPELKEGN